MTYSFCVPGVKSHLRSLCLTNWLNGYIKPNVFDMYFCFLTFLFNIWAGKLSIIAKQSLYVYISVYANTSITIDILLRERIPDVLSNEITNFCPVEVSHWYKKGCCFAFSNMVHFHRTVFCRNVWLIVLIHS